MIKLFREQYVLREQEMPPVGSGVTGSGYKFTPYGCDLFSDHGMWPAWKQCEFDYDDFDKRFLQEQFNDFNAGKQKIISRLAKLSINLPESVINLILSSWGRIVNLTWGNKCDLLNRYFRDNKPPFNDIDNCEKANNYIRNELMNVGDADWMSDDIVNQLVDQFAALPLDTQSTEGTVESVATILAIVAGARIAGSALASTPHPVAAGIGLLVIGASTLATFLIGPVQQEAQAQGSPQAILDNESAINNIFRKLAQAECEAATSYAHGIATNALNSNASCSDLNRSISQLRYSQAASSALGYQCSTITDNIFAIEDEITRRCGGLPT